MRSESIRSFASLAGDVEESDTRSNFLGFLLPEIPHEDLIISKYDARPPYCPGIPCAFLRRKNRIFDISLPCDTVCAVSVSNGTTLHITAFTVVSSCGSGLEEVVPHHEVRNHIGVTYPELIPGALSHFVKHRVFSPTPAHAVR